ncbi:MAG: glycosyltransferase family 4 protein [Burkholderiales bacterium]|nr:glycosyltransferase family 4 protein [Burkholderiales bacterium]
MLLAFFLSLGLTAACIHILRQTRVTQKLLDVPSARGLHVVPIPRIGGIAIFASVWALAGIWMQRDLVAGIAGLSFVLLAVSVIDDVKPLSAVLRLLVHAGAAILLLLLWVNAFGLQPGRTSMSIRLLMSPPGALAIALAIVWMTNLYNFMDGADGLAGGMSAVGFGTYAAALTIQVGDAGPLGLLATALTGASLGFLLFNFSPAKVFMGDAGAIPLGFLAAALGIHGNLLGYWPWWFMVLVFSPFIVDASVTLLRRTLQGHKPWVAHRDHFYQRLVIRGWSQRTTAVAYYALMLSVSISALVALRYPDPHVILLAWVIIYTLLLLYLQWHLRENKNNKSKNNDGDGT